MEFLYEVYVWTKPIYTRMKLAAQDTVFKIKSSINVCKSTMNECKSSEYCMIDNKLDYQFEFY